MGYTFCDDCGVNVHGFPNGPKRCIEIRAADLQAFARRGTTSIGDAMYACRENSRLRARARHK